MEQTKMKNNEMEQTKIGLMRTFIERQDPSSTKEVDDLTITRFLRDRDFDVEKATSKLLKFLKWRKAFLPNGSISAVEVPNEIGHNKLFLQGSDKKGRPIAVIFGAKHFQNKDGPDEFTRFVVYVIDKLCLRMPPGQEKFIVITDLEGWKFANSDVRGYIAALTIMQDYYPERLEKLFIVHTPSFYAVRSLWNIIHPLMDSKLKKKIVFVETKKLKSTLLEHIDESQLPEKYGGKLSLVPINESSNIN